MEGESYYKYGLLSDDKQKNIPEITAMKKNWEKPQLRSFGTIESVTQVQLNEMVKLGEFIVPGDGLGLFASLRI